MTAQAVILAGGQGTRLRPLTLARAKPVVPLLNRPFLAYQIALLRQHGVSDIILSCSYRVDDVRQALGDARDLGVTLRYVVEDEPLGTGGGVRNAADLARGTIFVLNGDVLTDPDLTAMRAFHEARGVPGDDPPHPGRRSPRLRARGDGGRRAPAPLSGEAGTGRGDHHEHDQRRGLSDRRPAPRPHARGPCGLHRAGILSGADRRWHRRASAGARAATGGTSATRRPITPRRSIFWGAESIHRWLPRAKPATATGSRPPPPSAPAARIQAPSVVGAGAALGPGAEVGPYAVIGPGSAIGAGARVQRAVLWERVRVGDGAVLRDCVIGADARRRAPLGRPPAAGPGRSPSPPLAVVSAPGSGAPPPAPPC